MFNQVDLSLGGKYGFVIKHSIFLSRLLIKPYETLLNYGLDAKKSQLQMGFYIKDEAESLDQVDVQQNTAFHKKVEGFKESLRENTL